MAFLLDRIFPSDKVPKFRILTNQTMKPSLAKLLTFAFLALVIFGLVSFGCQRQGTERKVSLTNATRAQFLSDTSNSAQSGSDDVTPEKPNLGNPSEKTSTPDSLTRTKSSSSKRTASKPTPAKPFPAWTQQSPPAKSNQQILITTKTLEITREAGSPDIPTKRYKGICDHQQLQEFLRKKTQQKGTDSVTSPPVIVRDGEKATVEIIKEFVYPVGPEDDAAVETENTGFTSYYQADHLGGEDILLKSFTRITEFEGFSEVNPEFPLPVFNRRDIESSDRLKSGDTIVIGGTLDTKTQKIEEPIFFGLIKNSSTQKLSTEVIMLITVELTDRDDTE